MNIKKFFFTEKCVYNTQKKMIKWLLMSKIKFILHYVQLKNRFLPQKAALSQRRIIFYKHIKKLNP